MKASSRKKAGDVAGKRTTRLSGAHFDSSRQARILIVDDHPVVREGFANVLKRERDFLHCGDAGTVGETFKAVEMLRPDVVLLDLWLGGADGLELIKSLKCQFPEIRILVVSFSEETVYAARALRAGARGYVMKSQPSKELVAAVRTVLANELYMSPAIAQSIVSQSVGIPRGKQDDASEVLTDRELQILQMLGAGQSTRKIAEALGLSFKTVETHRDNIKHKLHLRDAVELVHYATQWIRDQQPRLSPDDLPPTPALRN
jgi:DNA-binding NarL/FixJ family response regulator